MFKKIFALLFTIFSLAISAFAGPPAVHIALKPVWLSTYAPYAKDVPVRDVENGYFTQLSEEQINVEKQAEYTHVIRQIVSEAGIQNGSAISVDFDPSYQQLDFHEIIIWRDGKPQNRLTPGLFKVIADEEELDRFIYQGSYSAYCTLPDIRKGDRIEFSYTITGRNPIFDNHFTCNLYLQGNHTIAHTYWAIIAQPHHQLNFKTFNTKEKFAETIKNGLKYYTLEDFQVNGAHDYDNQPDWYTNYAHVQISDFSNWGNVVNWGLTVNPVPTAPTGKVAAEAAALKEQAKGDKVKYFRSAVKFVQDEVRYMGIEMGEYSHRANLPENVLNHRYGDCKDKSLLLATLLMADDIPANLVLISTSKRQTLDDYLPSPTIFNHCVVTANVNGSQVWVDPTISYQGGEGLNIYFPNYRKGLVLKPGNNSVTTIPPSPTGKMTFNEVYIVKEKNDTVDLKVVTRYTLNNADDLREELATTGIGKAEKNYLDYYQKVYPQAVTIDSLNVIDDRLNNVLTTTEHYGLPDFFKRDSTTGKAQAELYARYISTRLSTVTTKINYPLALEYPLDVDYTAKLSLPSGWVMNGDSYNVTRDAFKFNFSQRVTGDTLVMNYHLQNFASFVPVEKVDEYRTDIKKLKDNYLLFSFFYTPGAANGGKFALNYWMLTGAIVFALALAWLAKRLYTRPTPQLSLRRGDGIRSIGGWLFLIGFGLCGYMLVALSKLFDSVYFNKISFNARNNTHLEWPFKFLLTGELFGMIFLLCLAVFCFILFVRRRDIFPHYMIGFYVGLFLFYFIDYIGSKSMLPDHDFTGISETIARVVISGAIWISYLIRSRRVKETFMVPYPAYNFVIEGEDDLASVEKKNEPTTDTDNQTEATEPPESDV